MTKGQVLVISSCIFLVIILYQFGVRTPNAPTTNKDKSSTTNATADAPMGIDMQQLTQNLKAKLKPSLKDSITQLETNLAIATNKKDSLTQLKDLRKAWESAKYVEIVAYFEEKIAKLDSTGDRWNTAAKQLALASQISSDSTLRNFLLYKATKAYQHALDFDTANISLKIALATCYMNGYFASGQANQVMDGVLLLREVTKADSTNVPANLLLGRMAIVSGQFEKAINRLSLVTKEDEQHVEAFYYLGEALLATGKKEKAIEAFKKCKNLTKNPNFAADLDKRIENIINL